MENELKKSQKEIIIGTILGDGYLGSRKKGDAYLEIKQAKEHKEYVLWMYNALRSLCGNSKIYQRKDNGQRYFKTRRLESLTQLKKRFYQRGKKVIPAEIKTLLTSPLALAVWYMDDGHIDFRPKYHYSYVINTNCFSFREVNLLRKVLKSNFRLQVRVNKTSSRGKTYPRLYIGTESRDRFLEIVKPYILPCFSHKLPPL